MIDYGNGMIFPDSWAYGPPEPPEADMDEEYTLYVNAERTVLVRVWNTGTVEVCTREDPHGIWGPPITVEEERVAA